MRAMDGDAGDNAALTYTVEDPSARLYFEVHILLGAHFSYLETHGGVK